MRERILLRYACRAFSHLCGGVGMFALWGVAVGAPAGPDAALFLALATGLMIAANKTA